jgi:hypothetical protein
VQVRPSDIWKNLIIVLSHVGVVVRDIFLMNGSSLGVNYNSFAAAGEDPSPTSSSFSFGALEDHLVVGFIGGIVPAIEIIL